MTREATNRLYEMVEEGILTWEQIAEAALCYMSEDDVADMAHANEFVLNEEDEDEDEDYDESMDGDHETALASAGWGTDEDYGSHGGDEWA